LLPECNSSNEAADCGGGHRDNQTGNQTLTFG
jgi:hypothetical protein